MYSFKLLSLKPRFVFRSSKNEMQKQIEKEDLLKQDALKLITADLADLTKTRSFLNLQGNENQAISTGAGL